MSRSDWEDSPEVLAGVFDDPRAAQKAIENLRAVGFRDEELGIIVAQLDVSRGRFVEAVNETTIGASFGAVTGAGLGAAWGLATLAGVLTPIGPVVAGGVLTAMLVGAAGGGAVGAMAGALSSWGVSEEAAQHYVEDVKSGKTLVFVRTQGRYPEAAEIITSCGGVPKSQGVEDSGAVPPEHIREPSP